MSTRKKVTTRKRVARAPQPAPAPQPCAGCEARRETIEHLRGIIAGLEQTLKEIATAPRVAAAPAKPEDGPSFFDQLTELAQKPEDELTDDDREKLAQGGALPFPALMRAFDNVHGEGMSESLIALNGRDAARFAQNPQAAKRWLENAADSDDA